MWFINILYVIIEELLVLFQLTGDIFGLLSIIYLIIEKLLVLFQSNW